MLTKQSTAKLGSIVVLTAFSIAYTQPIRPAMAQTDSNYDVQVLVPTGDVVGANGMEFDKDGTFYVGSMMSGTVSKIDIKDGSAETIVRPPFGIADDLAISPDGTLVWTSMPLGIIRILNDDGKVSDLASNLPLINAVNFTRDGRLFASQVGEENGNLYEIDMTGEQPPRLVMNVHGALNGFEITDDDVLYGPLMHTGKIVRIDLKTEILTEIAEGFPQPTAVNFDSKGNLYIVDYQSNDVTRLDINTGDKQVVAHVAPPTDNLAVSADDLIYVSHPCDNGIEEINPETGSIRQIAKGTMGLPGGLMMLDDDGTESLLIMSLICRGITDSQTGALSRLPRRGEGIWASMADVKDNQMIVSSFVFGSIQWVERDTGEPTKTLFGFQAPYAVKFLSDGDVLLAEHGSGRILRVSTTEEDTREVVLEGLSGPLDMAMIDDDNFYVTESDSGDLSKINLTDKSRTVIAEGLSKPEGIAILSDGRLAIAETGAKRVILIDPQTGAREVVAEKLRIGLPSMMGGSGPYLPTGIATDSHGAIYMSSDFDHTVLKFTPR